MLNKFFNFLKGYVIIEISGKNTERFINICLRRGIKIFGLDNRGKTITASVYARDFKSAAKVSKKARVKIRIIKKCGILYFAKRYRKRAVFALCAALTIAAVYGLSCRVWAIEINGVKDTDIETIAALLEENGLYIGASKKKLPPTGEIKNGVLAKYPELSWLWVYMEGSKARVEVSERRIPPNIVDKETPCDIVSLSDGVINKVTVKSGDAAVKEGDAVAPGDKLISGRVSAYREGEEEKYIDVHAIGEVKAYTMHTASMEEPLYDEVRTPTGNKKHYITLEIFGKKYELFREKKTLYDNYDEKTDCYELKLPYLGYTGIAVTIESHTEVSVERREISPELASERARDVLEEKIAKELLPFSQKTDSRLEYEAVNNDTIKVKCTMSFIESIGTEEIIKE